MRKRIFAFTLLALALAAALAGCKNDPEQQRSVISVASLNCNNPGQSDVLEQGDSLNTTADDYYADDWVRVRFENKPYNELITTEPGLPHGDFLVTRYHIRWTRDDGGPVLPERTEQTSISVPSASDNVGYIRLVSLEDKETPVLTALQYAPGHIRMRAHITFYGHEVGTDRETSVEAALDVEFFDWMIATSEKPTDTGCNL